MEVNTMVPGQLESHDILVEIRELKDRLNELYQQKGPANSDYINLSLKLNRLMLAYIDAIL
jgi:hypothetical protein